MSGENITEDLTGGPGEFLSRPKRERFLVAVAGPLMNIGLAVFLLAINFMMGIPVTAYMNEPVVIGAISSDSAAEKAGLQAGDRIVAIDGEEAPTWRYAEIRVGTSPNTRMVLTVERDGTAFDQAVITGAVGRRQEIGTLGISPSIDYVVRELVPDSPAEKAGLQPGDEILEARVGETIAQGFYSVLQLVSAQKETPVDFQVRRDGETFDLTIVPMRQEDRSVIGVYPQIPTVIEQYGFFESFQRSAQRNWEITTLLFEILGKIFTGQTPLTQLSGPIEIARFSGAAAAQGLVSMMTFMAFISLQLGILNLLPIPILDGGVITLLAVEGVMGRDLSLKVKERIIQAGFIFLVLLMSVVIINDISKLSLFGN